MTHLPWIIFGLAVLFALTPRWTRPDLYFAVTVQSDFAFTPQARRILRQYWLELALHTMIALGLAGLVGLNAGRAVPIALAWEIIGFTWAMARAHRATIAYRSAPDPVREVSLSAPSRKLPGGWPLALGPLVILAASAIYAVAAWYKLPARIAVHWGVHGADRWVDKTPLNVGGLLALLASVSVGILLLSYGILHWSRRISVTGERARSESHFRDGILWLMVISQYLAVVPVVLLAFRPDAPAAWVWPTFTLVVIAIALLVLIRMGQGGSRVVGHAAGDGLPTGDHTPDTAWKWGQFYYNPSDPALIVEKRFGLGYTFNFGNRWSWVLLMVLLLPAFVSIALR
jgi:uncharacterized membrane protein